MGPSVAYDTTIIINYFNTISIMRFLLTYSFSFFSTWHTKRRCSILLVGLPTVPYYHNRSVALVT